MSPIRVFLDTEFTQFEDPRIISVGLAAEDGRTFYREFSDTYGKEHCSEFVKVVVLPLLSKSKAIKKSTAAVAAELFDFLTALGTDEAGNRRTIRIIADYHTDVHLVEKLWREACSVNVPGESDPDVEFVCIRWPDRLTRNEFKHEMMEYLKAHKLDEHHALNDARAIGYAFKTLGYEVA